METVGPPRDDVELHLLTEWSDPASRGRGPVAGVASVLVHIAGLALIVLLPTNFLAPPEPVHSAPIVTPLVEPLTEFTQRDPTKAKIAKELDMAALQARPSVQVPRAAPAQAPPVAPRPAPVPVPVQPPPGLPEPPKLEAAVKDPPKIDLPPANNVAPPPPTVQKPKLTLENVGGPPAPVPAGQSRIPIPSTSVSEAIRQNAHSGASSGGGLVVGDPSAGSGGYGEGINLSPTPGTQGSALELKSDPMGVDFRPYLAQILGTIRRNWYAVMPESVKLGRRGRVGLLFAITKTGNVSKVTWAFQSGADALDKAAVAAISASNPFPPLPAEFKGERVVLQLNFAYNVPKQ